MLDAKTGEILALANWPAFNPNNRQRTARDHMRNRALIDTFEPGSTLKPFTVAAALDAGKVSPQTIIDTAPGTLTIGHATIHDAHREGALTVEQVIQKSSNVGAAKIALSLPAETMWQMLSGAGFGAQPRTGFPGEVSGRLRAAKTWRPIEQATMAYGHGISVNLVQLARAYTVFASDGELKPVSLLKVDGAVAGRPVITPQTARAVRHMLEMVVQPGGTAPQAQIAGYRVAGKTGTAHKLEGRVYVDKYVSSFVGFAPVSNPRLIVAVMLDEPGAGQYYGGTVAAPVFANVMGAALRLLGVAPDAPANNVSPAAGRRRRCARKHEHRDRRRFRRRRAARPAERADLADQLGQPPARPGRRFRRVSGHATRRPRLHPRRDRPRRRRDPLGNAGLQLESRVEAAASADRRAEGASSDTSPMPCTDIHRATCGWSASPAPTARHRARTGSLPGSTRPDGAPRCSARSATG